MKRKKEPTLKRELVHWSVFVLTGILALSVILAEIRNIYNSDYSERAFAATVPTLSLNPASVSVGNNQTFAIDIVLDTAGTFTDGVDILSLRFNPSVLQVVDDNSNMTGVQITEATSLPITVINIADNTNGTIQFSQATAGGTNFTGTGTLGTIHFRSVGTGTSNVTFDYTPGTTTDTNVAYQGNDNLAAVVNAQVSVDATSPTVSITAPSAGSTVSGSTTVLASASDNVGVVGVQFKINGTNLGAEDTSAPYSITWDTTGASNASHNLTAVARDAATNSTTSSAVLVTVNNAPVNRPPLGGLDEINSSGVIRGWTYDPDSSAFSNQVRIYFDGSASTGTLITTATANIDRADVRNANGISGNHGFEFSVPVAYQDGRYHTVYAYGVDSSNSSTTTSLTNSGKGFTSRTVNLDIESRTNKVISGRIFVLDLAKAILEDIPFTSNSSGQVLVTLDIPAQTVYFKVTATPFLVRVVSNVNLSLTSTTLSIPRLYIGDLNQDNIINSIDFSQLNAKWFTADATTDLNRDGIVNSIDFSFMNSHWLSPGES